ncbi:hypothetical protein D1122_01430 [Cereibacter sphaeroides]|uniref:hypothetical protein n=1 Tax=Cereibacter sphaeroides TaxID=1063 RepID=UPI000E5B4BC8|nr:hypothetical protein [Cereibacter sphaeroides]RIA01350.1 hypothetical protein D1122_01430 [Cereibacter sphaeroides]
MAKPKDQFEAMARDAAERIEAARAEGQQLALLPDEPQEGDSERATRGKGRVNSQLRAWLTARGYRMPEDVLAEIAGLTTRDDVFTHAMAQAERVLAWAERGAVGAKGAPAVQTMTQRIETFRLVFTAALRAAEAAAPYGLAKVTPDVNVQQAVQVVVMPGGSAPADRPAQARDVSPQARRMAPPPMPGQIEQNQQVTGSGLGASDGARRTDEVKR